MKTLDRYLSSQFLRHLAVVLGVLIGLYGLIEFLERVDDFIDSGATLGHYLRYPLYKLPMMASQTLPMALLLAAFATIGQMSRTSQITALRSSGISFWQTTRPLFVAGALFSIIMLGVNGWIMPWSARESRYILETEIGGKPAHIEITDELFIRDGDRILSVGRSYPQRGEIHGISLLEFDRHFNLSMRRDAARGVHEGGHLWRLYTVTEHRFAQEGRQVIGFEKLGEQQVDLGRGPEELKEIWSNPQELTFHELAEAGTRLQREGKDARRYQSEIHFRIAQSVMPLIVVLLGVPFALQRGRHATLGAGVALSLTVFVCYLVLQAVGMALGSAGLLPLPVAAWAANILLLLVGAWLFLTLDN